MLSRERMARRGAMKNRPTPSPRETASMIPMLHPDSSCPSSSRAMLAERLRAFMPMIRVSI